MSRNLKVQEAEETSTRQWKSLKYIGCCLGREVCEFLPDEGLRGYRVGGDIGGLGIILYVEAPGSTGHLDYRDILERKLQNQVLQSLRSQKYDRVVNREQLYPSWAAEGFTWLWRTGGKEQCRIRRALTATLGLGCCVSYFLIVVTK